MAGSRGLNGDQSYLFVSVSLSISHLSFISDSVGLILFGCRVFLCGTVKWPQGVQLARLENGTTFSW